MLEDMEMLQDIEPNDLRKKEIKKYKRVLKSDVHTKLQNSARIKKAKHKVELRGQSLISRPRRVRKVKNMKDSKGIVVTEAAEIANYLIIIS